MIDILPTHLVKLFPRGLCAQLYSNPNFKRKPLQQYTLDAACMLAKFNFNLSWGNKSVIIFIIIANAHYQIHTILVKDCSEKFGYCLSIIAHNKLITAFRATNS